MDRYLRNFALALFLVFVPVLTIEAVTVNTEAELRQAIFDLRGSSPASAIFLGADITLTRDLPMILASSPLVVSGAYSSGSRTLDGNHVARAFFVASGTVEIRQIAIRNVVAHGGTGGNGLRSQVSGVSAGGGGGAGLGAAIFVNTGAAVKLQNVEVGSASAIGGNGGLGGEIDSTRTVGGGGGGGLGGAGGQGGEFGAGGGGGYVGNGGKGSYGGAGGGGEFGKGGDGGMNTNGGGGGGTVSDGTSGDSTGLGGTANGGNGVNAPGPGTTSATGPGGGGAGGSSYYTAGGNGGLGGGGGGPCMGFGGSSTGAGGDFGGGGGGGAAQAGAGGFGGGGGGGGGTSFSNSPSGSAGGFGAGGGGGLVGGTSGEFGGAGGSGVASDGGGGAALGGAIFVRTGGNLTLRDSQFSGDYAVTAGTTRGIGGASDGHASGPLGYLTAGTTLNIESSPFLFLAEPPFAIWPGPFPPILFVPVSTLPDAIAGPGGLVVNCGSGMVVVSGANTFTGGTVIRSGLLRLGDAGSLGSGLVEILNGGQLGGDGQAPDIALRRGGALNSEGGEPIEATSLEWEPDGRLITIAGPNSTPVVRLSGSLRKSGSGRFPIELVDNGLVAGEPYELVHAEGGVVGFRAGDFDVTGAEGVVLVTANALTFTVPLPPVYGVALSAAGGRKRASFTITNTGTTTTGFRIARSTRVDNSYTGPKPTKPGKSPLVITYTLDGADITKALDRGTAAVTLAAGQSARLVVSGALRGGRRLAFKRTIQTELSAISENDPTKSARAEASFVLKL